jgi:MFS family permease
LASDHIDRRHVLTLLCVLSGITAFFLSTATTTLSLLIGAAAFGAASNSLYAVSLAKAADNSPREEFVVLGSSVLLLNAVGAAIGSFVFGWAIRAIEGDILFTLIGTTSLAFAAFISAQPKGATAVATEDQSTFVAATSASAPAALQQDPRAGDIPEEDQLTAPVASNQDDDASSAPREPVAA